MCARARARVCVCVGAVLAVMEKREGGERGKEEGRWGGGG